MTLDIRSGEGVGPLHFGMSIRNARAALAQPLLAIGLGWAKTGSFLKDPRRDGVPVDEFSKLGLHLYYRVRGEAIVLVAVEMSDRLRTQATDQDEQVPARPRLRPTAGRVPHQPRLTVVRLTIA